MVSCVKILVLLVLTMFLLRVALGESPAPPDGLASLMRMPEPVEACEERLRAGKVRFSPSRITPHPSPSRTHMCGAPQVIRYRSGPEKIRWSSVAKMTCGMGLALARFEEIVQEEAVRHLGQRVVRIKHLGTYNCREMAAYEGWVSEHSYANAIDIVSFTLRRGTVISVRKHYQVESSKGLFLRTLARRLFEEDVFSGVLTPAFDSHHRGHIHLDLAHYRSDGTRPAWYVDQTAPAIEPRPG